MEKTSLCFKQSIFIFICLLLCSCQQKWVSGQKSNIKDFPPQMVGVWSCQFGPVDEQLWKIKFEKDGSITKIHHYVFGPMLVSDGGSYKEGPDPNTYMLYALGPIETEYNPVSKTIKAKVVIEEYEMKLPQGSLKGKIIDTLIGKVSEDGKSWNVDWRSYGWLEGATEPPIDFIDANPQPLVFLKDK